MTEWRLPEVNRVMLAGRLTRDPDKRYAQDGTPVTRFDLAFHRRYRTRNGTYTESTGFVAVITYQRLAEVCATSLHKGNAALVEGRLSMREWSTSQGERRSRLEIQAERVHFLERRPDAAEAESAPEGGAGGPWF